MVSHHNRCILVYLNQTQLYYGSVYMLLIETQRVFKLFNPGFYNL